MSPNTSRIADATRSLTVILFGTTLFSWSPSLSAASIDAGTIQREIDRNPPIVAPPSEAPVISLPDNATDAGKTGKMKVLVNRFVIDGATLISEVSLQAELREFIGKPVTLDDLNEAAARITAAYTRAGYLAQAEVPQQEIQNGEVKIRVFEARLGEVKVERKEGARLRSSLAAGYVTAAQPVGDYVRTSSLERALRLLESTPGVKSSTLVRPGSMPSTVDAVLTLDSSPLVTGKLGYDNYGGVSSGEHRVNADVNLESPFSIGDEFSLKTMFTSSINYGRIIYSLPLGTQGLRAGASASWLGYKLGGDFSPLDVTGRSFTGGAFLRSTLMAGSRYRLSAVLGYDYRHFIDDVLGKRLGDKSLGSATIGISGAWRDDFMAESLNFMSFSGTAGSLDLSRNASVQALDLHTAQTDGDYGKFNLLFAREQGLTNNGLRLYTRASGQLATKNLDGSEKFTLGGPYGVRAYPASEGSGDQGVLLTLELRKNIASSAQLFCFYDWGSVRQYMDTWTGWQLVRGEPVIYSLQGIGGGLLFVPLSKLSIRGTVATRLGSNPMAYAHGNDHDGAKRNPRFWLEAAYEF